MIRFENVGVFTHINTPTFSNLVILYTYPPKKMEQTECSETSAYKIQMPGNYPEENIQHIEYSPTNGHIIWFLLHVFSISTKFSLNLIELYRHCVFSSHTYTFFEVF